MEELHSVLPIHLQELFKSRLNPEAYKKNRIIYSQGDPAECFYYLVKGKAKVFISSPDGVEKVLTVASNGCILGEAAFFDEMPRVSSAKAMTACEVISVNRREFTKIIKGNPGIAIELLKLQAERIRLLSNEVDSMTFLKADCRIARILLAHVSRDFFVLLTHEEIAGLAGVSRVTVSKILSDFCKKGLILTLYRKIEITDQRMLEKLAYTL